MKKKSTSQSAFFNLRILTAALFCLLGIAVALFAQGKGAKQTQQTNRSRTQQDAPGTQKPDVVQMVGPVRLDQDLRQLPYIPGRGESEERRLTRYQFPGTGALPSATGTFSSPWLQRLIKNLWRPTPKIPGPLLTFEGGAAAQFCACAPPDSDGDVGPNHYVEAINQAFQVFDKTGTPLSPVTTYNSFFAGLPGPCGSGQNEGDPFVMYDHQADRWVISDFAWPSFPGSSFWQCIGVSQSGDPVAGPWTLYAIQIDPANTNRLGDYPKFAMWNSGGSPAQDAYFFTVNLFTSPTTFVGVRAFALDRESMLMGNPANAIAFTVPLAGVGDSYSFVAANFRTGDPPAAGRDEMVLAVDATFPGVTLTQVHARFFHVDFANPGMSTFGVGSDHTPNAEITVNPFVQAWTATTYNLVPQQGTADKLDTLGDKIMTPVVYQNRAGTESLWADQTTMLNFPNGPTAVSWYQFDVTGGNFPAAPVQQQEWTNGGDGLFRWMASIAVDQSGNTAIGYAASSSNDHPGIRYAGRLESDPPGNLAQGEATLFTGAGSQTDTFGRWGDYSMTTIDPADGTSFWSVGEYYANTSSFNWHTRVGKFSFGGGTPTPTPTATPTACSWSAGPDLPSPDTRSVGVFFPANGKFYVMGGRDANNVELPSPFEYDPGSNSWTTKSAMYPDGFTNNMACSVLTDSGTPYIYCAGGSNFATQTTSGRVFRYDPIPDAITTVSSNFPPGDAGILPGGFTAFNNTLVTLGGFDIPNGVGTDQIWQFTPNPAGWVLKNATLPVPLGYIPTTTIGSLIYTGGGADITGGVLTDTTNSFVYDPVADSISTIADIPRPTSNTRAVNFCNQMYVLGGAFNAPSNEVNIYDPVSNTWSLGIPFALAGRNFAADTDGTNRIWKAGGYADDGATIIASMEIFNCPVSPCGSPSPTPTATATATVTATATPTATATATTTPPPSPTPSVTVPPRTTPTPRPFPTPPPRP
jgi:hypothetical protein